MTYSKVVIDGDQAVYAAGFSCKDEPISHACQMIKKGLQKILNDTGCEDYELFISGKGNFREEVAVTQGYKANRTADKPLHYEGIRKYMKDVWGAQEVDGMEVDDKVSILLYNDFIETGGNTVILSSPDKDLLNTAGMHYNPRTRKKQWVTPRQAYRHFFYQMLTGDSVDNIKGLPHGAEQMIELYGCPKACLKGIGPASAKAIANSEAGNDDLELEVYRSYCMWGKSEDLDSTEVLEYMTEQGQLLWMIREVDDLGDPVMWHPAFDKYSKVAKEVMD